MRPPLVQIIKQVCCGQKIAGDCQVPVQACDVRNGDGANFATGSWSSKPSGPRKKPINRSSNSTGLRGRTPSPLFNRVDPSWNATQRPSKVPVYCPGDARGRCGGRSPSALRSCPGSTDGLSASLKYRHWKQGPDGQLTLCVARNLDGEPYRGREGPFQFGDFRRTSPEGCAARTGGHETAQEPVAEIGTQKRRITMAATSIPMRTDGASANPSSLNWSGTHDPYGGMTSR